jgi:hypothetical protein
MELRLVVDADGSGDRKGEVCLARELGGDAGRAHRVALLLEPVEPAEDSVYT